MTHGPSKIGNTTGFYPWDEGGISKSWTVLDELNKFGVDYRLATSQLTGKGFCKLQPR